VFPDAFGEENPLGNHVFAQLRSPPQVNFKMEECTI